MRTSRACASRHWTSCRGWWACDGAGRVRGPARGAAVLAGGGGGDAARTQGRPGADARGPPDDPPHGGAGAGRGDWERGRPREPGVPGGRGAPEGRGRPDDRGGRDPARRGVGPGRLPVAPRGPRRVPVLAPRRGPHRLLARPRDGFRGTASPVRPEALL